MIIDTNKMRAAIETRERADCEEVGLRYPEGNQNDNTDKAAIAAYTRLEEKYIPLTNKIAAFEGMAESWGGVIALIKPDAVAQKP